MAELLASKIVIQEEQPQLRNIPATKTAVIAAVGVAKMGPVGEAKFITSWDEYVRYFGDWTDEGELPMAIRGVYKQDPGAYVRVVRTVHYTNPASASTKTSVKASVTASGTTAVASAGQTTSVNAATWDLEPNQTLVVHCDEDVGGPDTATFTATRAVRSGSGLAIVDLTGDDLTLKIDGGSEQTINFTGAEASAQDVANTINATLLGGTAVVNAGEVDIYSDKRGTDSSVEITGGSSLGEIGHSVGTSSGTGNVADIDAVTFAELKSIVEAAVTHPATGVTVTQEATGEATIASNTTGVTSSVQAENTSTATGFGFDNTLHYGSATSTSNVMTITGRYDGDYAHDLRAVIEDATNGEANYFNLKITDSSGVALEIFPNLQIATSTDDDYCETVVNADVDSGGSHYFTVAAITTDRPDNATLTPSGGDDGLTGIADTDYLGDSAGGTGLHALDNYDDVTILTIPGQADSAIHNGMLTYCESTRNGTCFAVLDPPAGYSASQMVTYVKTTAALKNTSEYGAIYWPRINVLNPDTTVYGSSDKITVPPAAWVAGVYSRTDDSQPGGVYQPPAGIERGRIYGCLDFETDEVLNESKRDLVFPENINPISQESGSPRFIDGAKCLKTDGNFPSVSERRGVIYIEGQVKSGTLFARHSNNDASLRARIFRTVYQFLKAQMNLGAFRTRDPETAFFVDVSDALNPPSVQFQNKVVGRVGLATQKPAYWVIFNFSQDTDALMEEING